MFGRGRGGLEQNFVIYHQALREGGHDVVSFLDARAAVLQEVVALKVAVRPLKLWSHWDPFTLGRVRRVLRAERPDIVLTHGNRAGRILLRAAENNFPTVARLPNYRFKRVLRSAGFIATTPDQVSALRHAGVGRDRVFQIPNMLPALPPPPVTVRHDPLVIGAMGRFVPIKGFDVLLRALHWLRDRGHSFRATLAGEGEQRPFLERLAVELKLTDRIAFPGWVTDKSGFFNQLDIVCVPSLEEAFGLVVIEGMAHGRPVVVTDSEGPRQLVDHERTGLVVRRGDAIALGAALERVLADTLLARQLAVAGRAEVEAMYTISANVGKLSEALQTVVRQFRSSRPNQPK